jgi:hypothetical protein
MKAELRKAHFRTAAAGKQQSSNGYKNPIGAA